MRVRRGTDFVLGGDRLCGRPPMSCRKGRRLFRATAPSAFLTWRKNFSRISAVDTAAPGPSSQVISSFSRPSFAGQKPLAITATPEGTCTTFTTPGIALALSA